MNSFNVFKKVLSVVLCVALIAACFAGCTSAKKTEKGEGQSVSVPADAPNPVVTITMSDKSVMKAELYYDKAPQTVCNFIYLIEHGFYDGVIFHRIVKDFVIQAGDPTYTGGAGLTYTIKGEFSANGIENDLSHEKGVLSMARTAQDMDSASGQFFICASDEQFLDGQYAAFGKLIGQESFATLDKISAAQTDSMDRPVSDIKIATATVDTYGVDYPDPQISSGTLT